jgi:FtsZ-binding cell division protein ZapB
VTYSSPARRSDLVKYVNQAEDISKKEQDWIRTSKEYKQQFEAQCNELHIKGHDIQREIEGLSSELIDWYKKIEIEIYNDRLQLAVQYYLLYVQFLHGNTKDCIPTLAYLLKYGNSTHFTWREYFGRPIPKVDESQLEKFESSQKNTTNEIDWSALSEVHENNENDVIDIKWEAEPVEISMDGGFSMDMIDVVESSVVESEDSSHNVEMVHKWKHESVLENDESRFQYINDVLELESFFVSKIASKQDAHEVLMYMKNVPKEISTENRQDLVNFLESVKSLLEIINDERFKQVLMIKASKKYSDRLVASLKQTLDLIEKMKRNVESAEEKKKSLDKSIQDMKPGVQILIDQLKFQQNFLQDSISKLLGNRIANIFGEINKL